MWLSRNLRVAVVSVGKYGSAAIPASLLFSHQFKSAFDALVLTVSSHYSL
jgi:hypothetical protein